MMSYSDFNEYLIQDNPWPIARHVMVIVEIGINHNGDVGIAKELIDVAKKAGCDAVKFQKRSIDIVYSKEFLDSPRESPWGTTQREQKEALEFGKNEYDEIDDYCKKVGIDWFASAWDIPSQKFLRRYNLGYNKVASAMTTNVELLKVVAEENKPTFISTGMCEYKDIDAAVEIFKKQSCPFVLMHSVSEYPAPEETLNLSCIHVLRERYGCPIGYSGHESSVSPSVIAVALGVVAVERHITLNRAMYGSDHAASLEPAGLYNMVGMIRKIPMVTGDGVKRITQNEYKIANKLRYWRSTEDL